ncbi:ATP-dependent RNA helicase DBP9 [Westerdykella ornata]|uniref:RNA helicase n=1 Tax=Westerdykella ornata TaxID=318751 RepID=A0A6A6JTW9_WESOR|nr:ATP-dependent RNA helicase DBP9 [Westerdykella ornata]KAF2279827.1 ATP-dependent RNA helicase DBP9 [Westerdykella ornata]
MPAMKRKLNEHDVPEATEQPPLPDSTFASFGLEPRLLRGIRDQKWAAPQPIQSKAIPLALEGKDILGRSGTGTGKTAAYLLPILHNILRRNQRETSALILTPTKELASQITKVAKSLAAHCGDSIRVQNIAGKESAVVQRAQLAELPDIVVATPARANANMNNGALSLKNLAHLVVDEADLVMGYGFQEDLENIARNIPQGVQVFLMSATLNTELETLSGLLCRDPVILKLDDSENDSQRVKQYVIKCGEEEKFLLIYALFLLKLIKGKTIVFVADVERSYRVKLFLEQFSIKSCVLNSELPLTSRLHIVEEFNKNIYDILIASDENEILGAREKDDSKPPKKKAKGGKQDTGVSRGIDFLNVSNVLNFDLPTSYKSYFHRIGRTARAGKSGTAISFVIPKEKYRKHKPTTIPQCENDEEVLRKIEKHQKDGQKLEDYGFDMKKLEPFRYRFADALRAVTRIAVREARVKELRSELLKSQKLSRYFEENPETAEQLRHDQVLHHPARIQSHLKHVPDYLLPGGRKPEDIGFVGLEKERTDKRRIVKRKGRVVRARNGKVDPLKTFNKKGRGKK